MTAKVKLPRAAEALLADFPVTEPDFDAQAQAIEARLATARAADAVDDVLGAPSLTPEPGEPASALASPLPKGNFVEMARRSVQKKDDDAAQMAKELLAAAAQNRRPSAELVERVRAAGRAAATPLPQGSVEEPARPSGVVTRAEHAALSPAKRAPVHRGTIIGIAGTLVAIAACVALFLKPTTVEQPRENVAVSPMIPEQPPRAQTSPSPSAEAPRERGEVLSPEALAQAPVGGAAKASLPSRAAAARPAAEAKPTTTAETTPPVELEDEPQSKVAAAEPKHDPEPPLTPAEGSSGNVPLTPSAGAVSIALGAVRGGAQACLAGQSEPVSATVTFAADGRVLRVSAPGPWGPCIQAALSKARIAPFARETFSASTTVRPP